MPNSILMLKKGFRKYSLPVTPKLVTKIKNTQKLLKFGSSNISSRPNSILMLKKSFMKYLAPVRPKLVAKLKESRIC